MGNFLSRHAEYSTKANTNRETPDQKYEERSHRILCLDPRSPTAEIVRTPIQIVLNEKQDGTNTPNVSPYSKTDALDTPTSVYSTKAVRSSEVDLPSLSDLISAEDTCVDEFDDMLESIQAELTEIEKSYNPSLAVEPKITKEKVRDKVKKIPCQKLDFLPDKENTPKTIPKKARAPLGVRSSNTPADVMSPSSFLRMKQQRSIYDSAFQKFPLRQQNAFNCENTPPHAITTTKAATLPRKRAVVEWDKDTTMII